ncbi:NAD(P)-binding domain-containing protein [Tropicimonas marinistellae]|uniref:NAD(P)-binding domain-containing protein n=1 Tax=Tropicimonas marinistellae TaxID=1739787 RepID=UPI00082DCD45|nr:NAD(P)-binding domain-containing protein [Tropicimonas marinistellae]
MSRLGFIGTGHIAAPMVRFLAARGHEITVTRRNEGVSTALAAECGVAVTDAAGVLEQSDIVFLCLRPHVAAEVLQGLAFRSDHRIVSVMAGVTEAELKSLCAPAADFVQTIPLGFLEQGGCPLAAYGNAELLSTLFEPENPVVTTPSEAALNAHFAICAMVPGILDLMERASSWLGAKTGNAAASEFYTTQLTAGFLDAMEKGAAGGLATERDALATDGTLSLQMVDDLRSGGAQDALCAALSAIDERLNG